MLAHLRSGPRPRTEIEYPESDRTKSGPRREARTHVRGARTQDEDLKAWPGGDIHLSGGAKLAQPLVRLGLVDEYRFFVFPVYSPGKCWFDELLQQATLDLTRSTAFDNGAVAIYGRAT
jgi:dihydrofolate reductase